MGITDEKRERAHAIVYSCDSRNELAERIVELEDERDDAAERAEGLGSMLNDMFGELCGLVPPEQAQRWADQMERVGVCATWGFRA